MRRFGFACLLVMLYFAAGEGAVTPVAGADPDCHDAIDNCDLFDLTQYCAGEFRQWATDFCALSCGICQGLPTTPPPCVDVLDNCEAYGAGVCTDPLYQHWVKDNCRRTCAVGCTDADLARTTTLSPEDCVDKEDCRVYPQSACTGEYASWAKHNCAVYCGFCPGVTTAPKPCLDTRPNCNQYDQEMCTSPDYRIWAEDNCRQFCNFCTGPSGGAQPGHSTSRGTPPLPTAGPVVNTPLAPPPPPGK